MRERRVLLQHRRREVELARRRLLDLRGDRAVHALDPELVEAGEGEQRLGELRGAAALGPHADPGALEVAEGRHQVAVAAEEEERLALGQPRDRLDPLQVVQGGAFMY